MRSFLACIFVALHFAVGHTQKATGQAVYQNEALHLTYSYPSEFSPTPQVAAEMMDDTRKRVGEAGQQAVACVTTPFAAEHKGAAGRTKALFIIRVDLTCLEVPLGTSVTTQYLGNVANGALHEGLSKFPSPTFNEPVPYKLAAHDASFVQGSGSNGPSLSDGYSGVTCVAVERNAVCWAAFTPFKGRLPVLLSSRVAFGAGPAMPLVPPDLLPR